MRTLTTTSMLLAGAFLVLSAGTAKASEQTVLVAKVPFAFTVEGQTFPAGRYIVERDDALPSMLLIHGEKGSHRDRYVATMPAAGEDPKGNAPALAFTRDQDHYRLSAIWESRQNGHELER